jgi:hypothetical protein
MDTYFFDTKDGVAVRDRFGTNFQTDAEAITHSKSLAKQRRRDGSHIDADLRISVINASGAEIHCEMVNPTLSVVIRPSKAS